MKTDAELRADLMERLDAIPTVNASDLEVNVNNGMVTLKGQVDSRQTIFQVERTARRISGMRSLSIDIRPARPASRRHHF